MGAGIMLGGAFWLIMLSVVTGSVWILIPALALVALTFL